MKIAAREPSDSKFLISTWLPFAISTATCFTLFLRRNGDMLVVLGDETSGTWVEQQNVLATCNAPARLVEHPQLD